MERARGRGQADAPRRFARFAAGLLGWRTRAEPPGGWPVFVLVLASLCAATALLAPSNMAGQQIERFLGAGSPLAAVWPAWLAWRLRRGGLARIGRDLALLILSAVWLVALSLRAGGAGGAVGQWLVQILDDAFGRLGGLSIATLLGLGALVTILETRRVAKAFELAGKLGSRVVGSAPNRDSRQQVLPAFVPAEASVVRPLPVSDGEIVILGPRPPVPERASATPPGLQVATPATPPRPPVPRVSQRPLWNRPEHGLLTPAADAGAFSPSDLKARARVIEETLLSFNVQARVIEVQQGPAITQFGLDPAPGVAVNRIVTRQHDLALRLGAPSLRVLAPVPGRPLVGIEVPNTSVATVKLGDLTGAPQFSRARLPIGIGMDVSGKPIVGDLARMPHLLVAGATGSGKSVCINSLIASLLMTRTPDEVQLILIDPKQVEMSQYRGLPHLRLPVVTEMDKVVATLRWAVIEMERRYTRFSEAGARNISAFNERFPDERLSSLVIVIDELADMMMTAADDVERLICRLAQLGRAAGVHLVVATQRPSVDVLTGLIKANLPTRIAFAVSSQTDSRVILDHAGAERLLGRGDALYQPGDEMNPRRVQGAFVTDEELEALCTHWRSQGEAKYTLEDEDVLADLARQDDPEEKLLRQAREILAEKGGDVTVSYLQRRLKVGQQKAARIHQTLIADEAAAQAGDEPLAFGSGRATD